MLISSLILILFLLVISFLIVGLWRKRPIWAFIIAALILVLPSPIIGLIKTFQAVAIYGSSDPQLMAGGIREAYASSNYIIVFGLPLLALFQWGIRRLTRKRDSKEAVENTFL